jgi:hypothetical protein
MRTEVLVFGPHRSLDLLAKWLLQEPLAGFAASLFAMAVAVASRSPSGAT